MRVIKDWRLPTAMNQDGSGPCNGGDCTGSELGFMYFVNLDNPNKATISTSVETGVIFKANDTITDGNGNTVKIANLVSDTYWSGTTDATDPRFFARHGQASVPAWRQEYPPHGAKRQPAD